MKRLKIAVLFGGCSPEYSVSLQSAAAVLQNMDSSKYEAVMVGIYFAVAGMMGLQYACQNTFLALGNATVSIFLALLRKVILLLPLIFILPHVLPGQVKAVFWAEPFADMIAVTVTGILFFRKYGKSLCKKKWH